MKDGRLIKSQLWSFRSIQWAFSGSQLLIVVHCRKILVSRYNDHVPRCREVRTAGQSRSSVIGQLVSDRIRYPLGICGVLWVVCLLCVKLRWQTLESCLCATCRSVGQERSLFAINLVDINWPHVVNVNSQTREILRPLPPAFPAQVVTLITFRRWLYFNFTLNFWFSGFRHQGGLIRLNAIYFDIFIGNILGALK